MDEKFYEFLNILCSAADDFIDKNDQSDLLINKKIFAISSFLEFLKAGADVDTFPIEGNDVTFVIKLK